MRTALAALAVLGLLALPSYADSATHRPRDDGSRGVQDPDALGRLYYIDGAGNWGYGVDSVPAGLRQAGYRGRIINFTWSPYHDPGLDQTVGRSAARAKGRELAMEIADYLKQYPGRPVDI